MLTRLVRFFPVLLAFFVAFFLLFLPPFLANFIAQNEVSAAPLMQGDATPEPTPTFIPTPEPVAEVVVDLSSTQPLITAGETITYTVVITNTTDEVVEELLLSSTLPLSTTFVPNSNSPVYYDAETGLVTWDAGDIPADTILTVTYQIQADTEAPDTLLLAEVQATSPDLTETLEGWEVNAVGEIPIDEMWLTPEGGTLKSESKPVSVIVNSEALTEALYFQVAESSVTSPPSYIWSAFDLTATNKNDAIVTTFPTSITIAVNVQDYLSTAISEATTPGLYWYNETSEEWELIPSLMDWGTGILRAEVTHFSTYGFGSSANPSYGAQHLPTISGFTNNEWSGNSAVTYPIMVPPAPGNLPFGLALGYSSEGVNSLLGMERTTVQSQITEYQRQAGIVGWGWNLAGLGQVSRNLQDNRMYVSFGAGSFEITQTEAYTGSISWQSDPQTFVRVTPTYSTTTNVNARELVKLRIYTQDGITYTFGSENWGNGVAYNFHISGNCPTPKKSVRELHLTQIEDMSGNRIEVTYDRELQQWNNGCAVVGQYVRAIRPSLIQYFPTNSSTPSAQIRFNYHTDRQDDHDVVLNAAPENTPVSVQALWSEYHLYSIEAQINSSSGWKPARSYRLTHNFGGSGDENKLLTLTGILDYGAHSNHIDNTHLPTYTFSYTRLPLPTNNVQYRNTTVLNTANNGYGGSVIYAYDDYTNININGCDNNGLMLTWAKTDRYYVQQTTISDGMNGNTVMQYFPTEPFAHGEDYGGSQCAEKFQFGGYGKVTREVKQGTQVFQKVENYYHTYYTNTYNVSPGAGLLKKQIFFQPIQPNPSASPTGYTELRRVETNYLISQDAYYTNWVRKVEEKETVGSGGSAVSRRTEYLYDAAYQAGLQHGRVTHVKEYVNGSTTAIRQRETYYVYNLSNNHYLVRPTIERLIEGGTCKTETRYDYDEPNYLLGLDRGLVTEVEIATQAGGSTCSNFIASQFEYDSYGNQTATISPSGERTEVQYDDLLRVYPIQIKQPSVGSYHPTVQYTWQYTTGQVLQELDVNNGVHSDFGYDLWGRVKNAWAPLGGHTAFVYTHTVPYQVAEITLTKNDPPLKYQYTRHFYDGLGREIETKTSYVNPAGVGKHIGTFTTYHALGSVHRAYSTIVLDPATTYTPASSWASAPYSEVTYDALGRPTVQRAPNGVLTNLTYGTAQLPGSDWMHTQLVNVANSNFTFSYTDALGRLRGVEERSNATTPYALTRYNYDITDRLISVQDAIGSGIDSEIRYNAAGQKLYMNDPDMGIWNYRYDLAGNLKAQTDGNGKAICFNYDALNRPTNKYIYRTIPITDVVLSNGNCETAPIYVTGRVTNTYDSGGTNYWGRLRTTESQLDTRSIATYNYDQRGRVTSETQRILFQSTTYTFTTSYLYDVLNRVREIQYPANAAGSTTNGDKVTYDYDNIHQIQMTGATLFSNGTTTPLASNMTYNQFGQMLGMTYGTVPAINQSYSYYALNHATGLGRLQTSTLGGLWTQDYTYDTLGNITQIASARPTVDTQTQTFGYDFLNRLTNAQTSGSSNGSYNESYSYNQIGNILTKAGVTYSYSSNKPHAVTSLTNGNLYKYDNVGNMTQRSYLNGQNRVTDTLTYDNENRLTDITFGNGDASAEYFYDGGGNRIIAKVGNNITLYIGGIGEYSLNSGGLFTKYYYIGGQRIAMKAGSGTLHFFANDHLGSTSLTLNTNGAVFSEMRYKPFGETRWSSATTPTQRRYTGQIQDFATSSMQLYFYNARYYDPALARFTQADSIIPEPGNPQTLNRFSYVKNNPIIYNDPTGHCAAEAENDPDHADYGCWKWLWKIETDFPNVTVIPDLWTTNELIALWNALNGYTFGDSIANASITFARQAVYVDSDGEIDLSTGGVASDLGNHSYKITIFDAAYRIRPDLNGDFLTETPNWTNFTGAIIHELTHVATDENPLILKSYWAAMQEYGAVSVIGQNYGAVYVDEEHKARELIAMTVAVHETNSSFFTQSSQFWIFPSSTTTDWRQEWLRQLLTYGKWIGKGA